MGVGVKSEKEREREYHGKHENDEIYEVMRNCMVKIKYL